MNSGYLMAVDAGTGSCRAVLFDLQGNQVAMAQREWSHRPIPEYPGSQVFDTAVNWENICICIREVLAKSKVTPAAILAVSATSMREGVVLYDSAGNEIWACPNVDSRADTEARYLVETGLAQKIYSISGDWVAITSPARMLWIRNHEPDVHRNTAKLTMLSDWILYKLSGEFATDPSCGSSSGLFDIASRTWSGPLVDICGLNTNTLPNVYEPGTVIGTVHKSASEMTGLLPGTPVVMGGADTQLGLVGIGRTSANEVTVLGGSFWQHTAGLDKPLIDSDIRLRTLCHAVPNQWMIEGIGFYSGLTMRWFRDAFCQLETEEARRTGVDPYAFMEKMAMEAPPGANGIMGIFSNFMNAKRWMHATPAFLQFDILNPQNSGKKECIRAIEESAAYVANRHIQIVQALIGHHVKEIVFTGGAANGQLWPQILADVVGCRVNVPTVKESSALGAAICAGVGAGVYQDLINVNTKGSIIERTFEPNQHHHEKYKVLFRQWSEVYQQSLQMVEAGNVAPLWKAIGI